VLAALAAIPKRLKISRSSASMAIFARSKRHQGAYKTCARSYPWVGERIDRVLPAESSGSIDEAFTTIRIELAAQRISRADRGMPHQVRNRPA
jgi:hypothetical protein